MKYEHRHSAISESLRLDHIERELLRGITLPRIQAVAALAAGVNIDTKLMLSRYHAMLGDFRKLLPPYMAPESKTGMAEDVEQLKERYRLRKAELDEIARTTVLN